MFAEFTWWDSKCDIPYTANMEYTFSDGTVIKKSINGSFHEVYITESNGTYHSEDLKEGEHCGQGEVHPLWPEMEFLQ